MVMSRVPGPIGTGENTPDIDAGTSARARFVPPGPAGTATGVPWNDVDPDKERRYTGAFYNLSEKFGSDFTSLFVAGHLSTFTKTVSADAHGQASLAEKIDEFDFTSLRNTSADPDPPTLDLQSVMSWRLDAQTNYVKGSWKKRDFAAEPPDKKAIVDNPGFRASGDDGFDRVSDLGAANAAIRFIVRLMIVERPLAADIPQRPGA
jgi:hypothetical protein